MRALGALLLLLFSTASARAEEIVDAKIHYQAGVSYYEHGDWLASMREFNEAYRLSHRGALLFNIAQCEEKLDMFADAIASLRAYLMVPESEKDRPLVREKLKALEGRVGTEAPAPEPAPAPVTPAPATGKLPALPLVVIGGGAVLLVASLVTGIVAHLSYSDLSSKCGPSGNLCPPDFTSQRDLGQAMALTSDVLLAVGAVAAAVGVVLLLVTRERPSVKAALAPDGPGAMAVVRF